MPSRERSSRTWTHIDPKAGPIRRARGRWLAPALATVLGALVGSSACSSSSTPNPPMIGSCTEKNGVPCTSGAVGGGPAPEADGGSAEDATSTALGDASSCTGATQIFGTAPAACITCIATSCCLNPTSCPNDTSCAPVALCVLNCLPTDPSCVQGCEAQASQATITAFNDLASCSASTCPNCPTLQTASGDL
jgi:hypothetical protein